MKAINFTAENLRKSLDGLKWQTRRVVKPTNSYFGSANAEFWKHAIFHEPHPELLIDNGYIHVPCHSQVDCERCENLGWIGTRHRLYPKIEVGDTLAMRTTWAVGFGADHLQPSQLEPPCRTWFASDGDKPAWAGKSRPAMFLPKCFWHLCPKIEITRVRVERLQSISEADCIAEGIYCDPGGRYRYADNAGPFTDSVVLAYRWLWESINGKGSWDENPFVWVYEYRVM